MFKYICIKCGKEIESNNAVFTENPICKKCSPDSELKEAPKGIPENTSGNMKIIME